MRESIEHRLDALLDGQAPGMGAPERFLDAVARERRRRRTLRAALGAGATACASVAVALIIGRGAPMRAPVNHARTATTDHLAPVPRETHGRSGAREWTLAALSRRMGDIDTSDGDALIPGGWSMGWTTRPPL